MRKIVFLLLMLTNSLLAQIQFETKVSKNSLGLNERLRVDFIMNDDGDNFTPPNFDGFRVVGGPSQQVSQSWINGRSSFQKSYSYYLLPLQKGTLTIRQASVEINGHIYKTNPVKINVTNAIEQPKDPNNAPQISANDALHLVAEVSKANPYINEPITVVYKLYFSYNIGISNWRELNKPKYNNFWSQNIDIKELVAEEGKYNGERYRYVVLRKTVLYPQKSGKLEIEPLSLDLDVQLPTNRRDVFGRVHVVEDSKRVSAPSRVVTVKPLPESGKPEDFSGAVGNFSFKVTPSKTTLKNGESLELKVAVTGKGNLKLFDLPKPVVPNSFEMYDPVHSENVQTPLSGMTGSIIDSYTIIPQFKGKYPIKPMTFSYFDLRTNSYKRIASPEIMIDVMDGPTASQNDVASANTISKNKISATEQFKFIKSKTKLQSINQPNFFGSGLYYGLLVFPFLLIPAIVLFKKKKEAIDGDIVGNRIKKSNALAKKYLSEAKKHINNKEPFYIALEKALHNFLKAKLHIETSEMSKEKITEILLSRKATPETVMSFIKLSESCEFARYAPSTNEEIHHDYDKAVAIISDLEKQIAT
jgi:hypothetical protein